MFLVQIKVILAVTAVLVTIPKHAYLADEEAIDRNGVKLQSKNIYGTEFSIHRLSKHAKSINSSGAAVGAQSFVPLAPSQVTSLTAKGRE